MYILHWHKYHLIKKFSKISQKKLTQKNFEASANELHVCVSVNFAASSKRVGWVSLTPYLTLKNHVR